MSPLPEVLDADAQRALEGLLTRPEARLEAARALLPTYRQARDISKLLSALAIVSDDAEETQEKVAALREAAALHEQTLKQPPLAFAALARAVELAPDDAALLAEALHAAQAAETFDALAEVLEDLLPSVPDRTAKKLMRVLADVHEAVGDAKTAARYLRLLLDDGPDPDAFAALERLLQSSAAWTDLADLYEAAAAAGPAAQRQTYLQKARALMEREMARPERAYLLAVRTLLSGEITPALCDDLERLAALTQNQAELAEVFQRASDASPPGEPLAVELLRRAARLHDKLGQRASGLRLWMDLLLEAPADEEALGRLEQHARAEGDSARLASVLTRRAERESTPALQAQLWLEAGEAFEHTGAEEQALESFRKAHTARPTPASAAALARALGASRRFADQAELLSELSRKAEGPAQGALVLATAEALERAGRPEEAIATYQRLLSEGAHAAPAAAALHRLLNSPAAAAAARALEPHARSGGDPTLLIGILEARLTRALPVEIPAILAELATLREQAGHVELALAARLRLYALWPTDEGVRAALEKSAAASDGFEELVAAFEDRLEEDPPQSEQALLRRKLAHLYEQRLSQPQNAAAVYEATVAAAPGDVEAWRELLRLRLALGQAAEAVRPLQQLAELVPAERTDRLMQLAQLAEDTLADHLLAAESLRKVLDGAPHHPVALAALERVLSAAGRIPELAALHESRAHAALAAGDVPGACDALLKSARLKEEVLSDPDGAARDLNRLLQLRPEDVPALAALERLCERLRRWGELVQVLSRRCEVDPHADALVRLGAALEDRLEDPQAALEKYVAAVRREPAHAAGRDRLARLLKDDALQRPAAVALADACRRTREGAALAPLLELCAKHAPSVSERKALYVELGELRAGALDEPELAFLAFAAALRADPDDALIAARLVDVALKAQAAEELATLFEELLQGASPGAAAALALRAAAVLVDPLGELDRAAQLYERARAAGGHAAEQALFALSSLYERLGRFDGLREVLRASLQSTTSDAERQTLWLRIARACEALQDRPGAIEAYERALALSADLELALRGVAPHYEATGEHRKLLSTWSALAAKTSGEERDALECRLAQLSADKLADVAGAVSTYRRVLERTPESLTAFEGLSGLLEAQQRYDELCELLKERLKKTYDAQELVRQNLMLARVLASQLGQPEQAAQFFASALGRDPGNLEALEGLKGLHEAAGRKDDLATVLQRLAALDPDPSSRKAHWLRLSEVQVELRHPREALDAARRALEHTPHSVDELTRARTVLEAAGAPDEAAEALAARAELELAQDERYAAVATLYAAAELWRTGASAPDKALKALRRILAVDAGQLRAFRVASELLQNAGEHASWAELCEVHLAHLDREGRSRTLAALSKTYDQQLADPKAALGATLRLLELEPNQDAPWHDAARLAAATGAQKALADAYERATAALGWCDRTERMLLSLADLRDEALDDLPGACAALEKILTVVPDHAGAFNMLEELYRRRGQFEQCAQVLERRLEVTSQPSDRRSLLHRLAATFDEDLSDPARAAATLQRAVELGPDASTLSLLAALHRRERQFEGLIDALLRSRELASGPAARSELQTEIAEIYERELKSPEAAIAALIEAVELDAGNERALAHLERLYQAQNRPSELERAYRQLLARDLPMPARLALGMKRAGVLEKLGDWKAADAQLCEVLAKDPEREEALRELARIRRLAGQAATLVPILEHLLRRSADSAERADLHLELGDLWRTKLERADLAVPAYEKALQEDPSRLAALRGLSAIHAERGTFGTALALMRREAKLLSSGPEAAALWLRMAQVYEEKLKDAAAAKDALAEALRADPKAQEAYAALKALHLREKNWRAYEEVLLSQISGAQGELRANLALEAGRFFSRVRHERELSIRWYQEALAASAASRQSALALAELLMQQKDLSGARQALEAVTGILGRKVAGAADPATQKELGRQLHRLAEVCEQQGRVEDALVGYSRAYQHDPTLLRAVRDLGALALKAGRRDEARRAFENLVTRHRDQLKDTELLEALQQLGEVHASAGQHREAIGRFEEVLKLNPRNQRAHRALIAAADAASDHATALQQRWRLVPLLEGDARVELCLEIGKLQTEQRAEAPRIIEAYLAALAVQPDCLSALDALWQVYRGAHQPQKALKTLETELGHKQLVSEPRRRKALLMAQADLLREVGAPIDRAISALEEAQLLDVASTDAFDALDALLATRLRWTTLDDCARRLLTRLPQTGEAHAARMHILRRLGKLYRTELPSSVKALQTYQQLAAAFPDDVEVHEVYAKLASAQLGEEPAAVEAYRRVLLRTTDLPGTAAAFAKVAVRCANDALSFNAARLACEVFDCAEGELTRPLAALRATFSLSGAGRRPVSERMWRDHLLHPACRGPLAEIWRALYTHARAAFAQRPASFGIRPDRHWVGGEDDPSGSVERYRHIAWVLGLERVKLYSPWFFRDQGPRLFNAGAQERDLNLSLCLADDPCLKAGGRFFQPSSEAEQAYLLGQQLAQARPELALTSTLPFEQLEDVFHAALSLCGAPLPMGADTRSMQRERKRLQRALDGQGLEALGAAVEAYHPDMHLGDLAQYVAGTTLSAMRAGLFAADAPSLLKVWLSGDEIVATPPQLRELIAFLASDDLVQLTRYVTDGTVAASEERAGA